MKLKPSQIPGFLDEYESPFPAAEMSSGVPGSAWANLAEVTAPARAWRATSRISMLSVGRLATQHGVFKAQVPDVKRIGDLGRLALGSDFVEVAKSAGALAGELLNYSDALTAVASRIPVIGAYAGIIVGFITFLKNAFSRGKSAKLTVPKTARDALGYNRSIDVDVTNAAAEHFAANNWTRIFLPSWTPGDSFKLERTSFVGDGTPDGYSILPYRGVQWEEGLGFCPGVAGRLVQWQYPLKVFNSNRPASPWESLISIADLEPSVTQLTVLAWQMVLKNGPNMFRVDAMKVQRRWSDFFEAMEHYSRWLEGKDEKQAAEMANAIATWWGPEYKGGPDRVRSPWTKYKPGGASGRGTATRVPNDVSASAKTRQLVDYIISKQLIGSYLPALSTLTCAYVGPGFAAFNDAPWLRDYWLEMRKRLLEHPKRFDVELGMIPDRDYRSEMERAQRNKPEGTTPQRVTVGFGGVPGIDVPAEPPPTDEDVEPSMPDSAGGGSGGLGRGDDDDSGGGGGAVLALGGALALGYFGVKKFGKRKVT